MRARVVWIARDRFLEERDGSGEVVHVGRMKGLEKSIIGLDVGRATRGAGVRVTGVRVDAGQPKLADDGPHDRILDAGELIGWPVEGAAPKRRVIGHAHELRRHVEARGRSTHRALNDHTDAELRSDGVRPLPLQLSR
jgi:hypothetical protein